MSSPPLLESSRGKMMWRGRGMLPCGSVLQEHNATGLQSHWSCWFLAVILWNTVSVFCLPVTNDQIVVSPEPPRETFDICCFAVSVVVYKASPVSGRPWEKNFLMSKRRSQSRIALWLGLYCRDLRSGCCWAAQALLSLHTIHSPGIHYHTALCILRELRCLSPKCRVVERCKFTVA